MSEPDAVAQATNLLSGRLRELDRQRFEIEVESRKIKAALESLGGDVPIAITAEVVDVSRPFEPWRTVKAAGSHRERVPVRAAVKALLNSENRAFDPSEIQDLLDPTILGGRNERQIRNVIRTSLHTLRESGEAHLIDGGRTIASQWIDNKTNEGSSAGTEEPSVTATDHEGGGGSGDLPDDSYSQGHVPD